MPRSPRDARSHPVSGNPYRTRDPLAASLTEVWLVSAVVAILAIRGYLELTGYPQIGGSTYHFAHMLWGGLGMVVGFGMLMLFANGVWKPVATVVSGAGFGTFIDELGKFITQDNDYFFEPTIALIYAICVVFFLLAKVIDRRREATAADHLFLAAQGVQWAAIGKLDVDRQRIALDHLDRSGIASPITRLMRETIETAELVPFAEQSRILEWRRRLADRYWTIVASHWLERIVIGLFIFKAIQIVGSFALGIVTDSFSVGNGLSFAEGGAAVAAAISGALAAYGVFRLLRRARIAALHAFAGSTLFSLLFGQFFAFASSQFAAFGNLIIELLILGVIRFALAVESTRHDEDDDRPNPQSGIGRLF